MGFVSYSLSSSNTNLDNLIYPFMSNQEQNSIVYKSIHPHLTSLLAPYITFRNDLSDLSTINKYTRLTRIMPIMKKSHDDMKNDELFFGLLKDQFVLFYALTNVAIEAFKSARNNYCAKVYSTSKEDNETS